MSKPLAYLEDAEGKHAVLLLSRPNAIGLVDVEFDRTGERRSVPARSLQANNEIAAKLLRAAESFVSVPSIPKRTDSFDSVFSSLHDRLRNVGVERTKRPGIIITRTTAGSLVGNAFGDCPAMVHEFRLFYSRNGDNYIVRAWLDEGLKSVKDWVLQHQISPLSAPLVMPPTPKPSPPPIPSPSRAKEVKATIHPVLGIAMRYVNPLPELETECGSLSAARLLLLDAKQIEQRPVPGALMALVMRMPDGRDLIVHAAKKYLRDNSQQWVIAMNQAELAAEIDHGTTTRWATRDEIAIAADGDA